jgi:hypothetical protein
LNGSKKLLMRRESQWTGHLSGLMMPAQRVGRIMLKVINQWNNEDGFPVLHWEQMVPTGESLHSAEQGLALKIAAVVGVFVFAAVYAASEQLAGAMVTSLATLLLTDQFPSARIDRMSEAWPSERCLRWRAMPPADQIAFRHGMIWL